MTKHTTTTTEAQRRRAVELALANQRLEGIEPSDEYKALLERYVKGEISLQDVQAASDAALSGRRAA
jgi:hypothetical protein